ncbi:MAG: addiction module protein [Synechocystis sp.]
MLTLEQLIAEATALPDVEKTILMEKIVESMVDQTDQELLAESIHKAQKRLTEIDSGVVQAIPGEIALAQIRQLLETEK